MDEDENLAANVGQALAHHMLNLRTALARLFWRNDIYIGRSVLDEFVFQIAKRGRSPILPLVLDEFSKTAAGLPGFVIYPLHGFGLARPPIMTSDPKLKSLYSFKKQGLLFTAQSNDLNAVYHRLNQMVDQLQIQNSIDFTDLQHLHSMGVLKWLTRNPLVMVKVASHTGEYYENQFVYTLKLRLGATLAVMLWALAEDRNKHPSEMETTAKINNWQTLDFHHYLIGETRTDPKEPIELRRVPMNLAPLDLAQLSDVSVSLNTRTLQDPWMRKRSNSLQSALQTVERAYMSHVNLTSGQASLRRFYARLVKSLDWYRRSFGSRQTQHERAVSLAVAFETMLTDFYAAGTADRLERRVGICLKGLMGVADYKSSVKAMVYLRNEILHTGQSTDESEIVKAQAAFALCFIKITSLLAQLPSRSQHPIKDMLND
ncbi:hypothetical protein C8024_08500 [Sphingopyxis sp. BSNA05]|nr:hypothetical protein [Sphingopyxis sp. BSNA05]